MIDNCESSCCCVPFISTCNLMGLLRVSFKVDEGSIGYDSPFFSSTIPTPQIQVHEALFPF